MKVHLLLPFLFGILNAFVLMDNHEEESMELPKPKTQAPKFLKRSAQNCGSRPKLVDRIIGGEEADEHGFPWMASFRYEGDHFCAGSLIASNYVLTGSPCLGQFGEKNSTKYRKYVPHIYVVLGDHYWNTTEPSEQIFGIANYIYLEPNRNRSGVPFKNDVSVVKLNGTAIINRFVNTICLPNPPIAISPGDKLTIVGWGMTKFPAYGVEPEYTNYVLKEGKTEVIKNEDCSNFFTSYDKNGIRIPYGIQAGEDVFCTVEDKEKDGISTIGDAGGPVMYIDPITDKYVQVGIVSYGTGRIAEEGHTNVTFFLKDIEGMMADMDEN